MAKSVHPRQLSARLQRGAVAGVPDGRSAAGRYLRDYEASLLAALPRPTVVQRALIVRAARLALHLEQMDDRTLAAGRGMGKDRTARYLAAANTLSRILERIGIDAAATGPAVPTALDDYVAAKAAQRGDAA